MSGPNLAHSSAVEIDLIGPLPEVVTPQDLLPNGITQAQFQMDPQHKVVTCPQGHQARHPKPGRARLEFSFSAKSLCRLSAAQPLLYLPRRANRGHEHAL